MRFEKLRTGFAKRYLKKLDEKRPSVQPGNWDEVVRIGILACGTQSIWLEKTVELIKDLRRDGKKVDVLLYVRLPKDGSIPVTPEGVTVLTDKDLHFNLSPKSAGAEEFIARKFDILWDLNTGLEFPLLIASKQSQAGFKAGMDDEWNKHLDFSISMRSMTQDKEKMWELIENLKKYVKQLHY